MTNDSAALAVDETTRIQRGKYALRMRSPLPATAFIASVVDSTKNVQMTIPKSSSTGKSLSVPPVFNSTLKTRYMIPKSINGLTSDHTYPSADPVYFSLNCVIASSRVRLRVRWKTLLGRAIASRRPLPWATTVMVGISIESELAGASPEFEHTKWRRRARAAPTICFPCNRQWTRRAGGARTHEALSRRDGRAERCAGGCASPDN